MITLVVLRIVSSKSDTIKSGTSKKHESSDSSVSNCTINPGASTNSNK